MTSRCRTRLLYKANRRPCSSHQKLAHDNSGVSPNAGAEAVEVLEIQLPNQRRNSCAKATPKCVRQHQEEGSTATGNRLRASSNDYRLESNQRVKADVAPSTSLLNRRLSRHQCRQRKGRATKRAAADRHKWLKRDHSERTRDKVGVS